MNIQQKKKNLQLIINAGEVFGVGNVLYMVHTYLKHGPEKAIVAGGAGMIGLGIFGVLIYKTETSIYGFSPTLQRK